MIPIAKGLVAGLLLLVVIAVVAKWQFVVCLKIHRDLHDYAKAVRSCKQPLHEKERLLEQVDSIEARLSPDVGLSLLRWWLHDDAIRSILANGITTTEVRLLEREFAKIERELTS